MKGYFDRIEEESLAVIIVEELNKQFIKPVSELPEGSSPGMWLDLTIVDNTIMSMTINKEATITAQQRTNELMSKLHTKSRTSKFKKKS